MNQSMKVIGIGLVLAALVALAYFGGKSKGERVVEQFDRTDAPVLLTFVIYDTQQELQAAHEKQLKVNDLGGRSYGFAVWYQDEEDINECVLHVLKPQHVDDEITLTWGHELAHCAYGLYHNQEHK